MLFRSSDAVAEHERQTAATPTTTTTPSDSTNGARSTRTQRNSSRRTSSTTTTATPPRAVVAPCASARSTSTLSPSSSSTPSLVLLESKGAATTTTTLPEPVLAQTTTTSSDPPATTTPTPAETSTITPDAPSTPSTASTPRRKKLGRPALTLEPELAAALGKPATPQTNASHTSSSATPKSISASLLLSYAVDNEDVITPAEFSRLLLERCQLPLYDELKARRPPSLNALQYVGLVCWRPLLLETDCELMVTLSSLAERRQPSPRRLPSTT